MGVDTNLGKTDVAIVGGGVVGVACALELARRGAAVRVLERGRLGHGCSYGNAGWLTASLALPLAAPGQTFKALGWLFDRESPFYIRPRFDPALASWLLRFLANSRPAPFERGARALIELSRWSVDFWERLERSAPESFGFERVYGQCIRVDRRIEQGVAVKQFFRGRCRRLVRIEYLGTRSRVVDVFEYDQLNRVTANHFFLDLECHGSRDHLLSK